MKTKSLFDIIKQNNRYQVTDGSRVLAYPEEPISKEVIQIVSRQMKELNYNVVSSFYYEGYLEYLRDFAADLSEEILNLPSNEKSSLGVLVMPNTTNSLKQAVLISCQYLFRRGYKKDFSKEGIYKARELGFKPVIIAPVTSAFLLTRVSAYLGWGEEICRYYDLDSDFQPNLQSLEKALQFVKKNGETPVVSLVFGGDAPRGIFPTNLEELNKLQEKYFNKIFIFVDSCSQWLVAYANGKNKTFDYSHSCVDFISVDPQKQGFPHFNSWLLIRDANIFTSFYDTKPVNFSPIHILRSSIMTSKGVTGEVSFMDYVNRKGYSQIKKKGFKDFSNSQYLRKLIRKSDKLELYQCDGRIVSFGVKNSFVTNWELAQALNNSSTRIGKVIVGYENSLRAFKQVDYFNCFNGCEFDGLFGTVTGIHIKKKLAQLLKNILNVISELEKNQTI